MATRTTQLADGGTLTLTVAHADGGRTEETRRDTGDGSVSITTKHPNGKVTEKREAKKADA